MMVYHGNVGDKVRWHIRPLVHVEHGGYLETEALTGFVRSLHSGHIMVGTGTMVRDSMSGRVYEQTYAVQAGNPSLRRFCFERSAFLEVLWCEKQTCTLCPVRERNV